MLYGKRVALLVADGFEEVELTSPQAAVRELGGETAIVAPKRGFVRSWTYENWGDSFKVNLDLAHAAQEQFHALVIPGGVLGVDKIRCDERAVAFVRDFIDSGKPVGAICHGPWLLIEAQAVQGRRVTSYRAIRTDLVNAGAQWVNEVAVIDRGVLTSRAPSDLLSFNQHLCELLTEGGTQYQMAL